MPSRSRAPLSAGEGRPVADRRTARREIGDAAVQIAVRVLVEGTARRVGRVPGDARHRERLAVVELGVAAAVAHDHRMFL